MSPRRIAQLLATASLLAASRTALADNPDSQADAFFVQGNAALAHGDYAAAERAFRKAIAIDDLLPGPWRNLGQALDGENRQAEAIKAYERYVALAPDGEYVKEVQTRILEDKRAMGMAPPANIPEGVGAVRIDTVVTQAHVFIDGLDRGVTPLPPFAVSPGPHVVRVAREGCDTFEKAIDVTADVMVTLQVVLAPPGCSEGAAEPGTGEASAVLSLDALPPGAVVTVDGVAASQPLLVRVTPGRHEVTVTAPSFATFREDVAVPGGSVRHLAPALVPLAELAHRRQMGEVLVGAAVAAGLVGAGFGIAESRTWQQARDAALQESLRPSGATGSPVTTRSDLANLASRGQSEGLIAYAAYGVALLCLGGSVYYLVRARDEGATPASEPSAPAIAVTAAVAPGEAGVAAEGSFSWLGGRP